MHAINASTAPLVLSLAALLTACAGGPPGSPGGPFGSPPPPIQALFISPFGEPFVSERGQPWPSSDWFLGADDNLDGAVTLEEFTADGQRYFAALDSDRDGRLNQTELATYEAGLRAFGGGMGPGPQRQGRGAPGMAGPGAVGGGNIPLAETATLGVAPQSPPGGQRPRGGRGQGYGTIAEAGFFNLPQPVKSADTNVDQRVTTEEWATATARWFYSLDADRDGRLILATLPVTPLQARAARRG